ncbi:MAG: DNA polymerase III subunit chi [Hydrogenophaga sp.]|jgi:DNA polymerase-3 subunit chi|uniref:DNA polymerase III subunit chi n=1 Tax=Hydrogenophaga sp. TaxID=1904254 RepID=UPI001D88AC26|nr:DNA polymerase III subunit chi [Hydrogenophaga sp.]MBW0172165.1 DNA polymerase III subunit chi [Hydrogenophaga sp.]MBW0186148.1 DNA polymerase III subunit chi [Hydrogenophaga sp.]
MTEVAFHFNAPDKLGYACRLLRKAYLRGARVVALVDEADRAALDSALWTQVVGEFVPHSGPGDPPHVQTRSPIHIASDGAAQNGATVLVNLRAEVPPGFERYARVIEVVTVDAADRGNARERWKHYKAQGIEPQRHDLQLAPQD